MGPVGGFQGNVATADAKEGQAYQQAVFPLWRVFYSGRNTPCHRTSLELETLSGESHKEGRLYQAGSFMPRRGMVAKKGDGGMYFFFITCNNTIYWDSRVYVPETLKSFTG